jgi:excisionase family DNA binding protein
VVAELLSVHPQTVYHWLREGRLDAIKIGPLVRIPVGEYHRFVDESPRYSAWDEARRRWDRDHPGPRSFLRFGGPSSR